MKPSESLTIVAIPEVDDITWKLSSEKVPHMTILFLGDQSKNPNVVRIAEYLEHAADQLCKFGMSVNRRDLLGEHDADVLFFEGNQADGLRRFRSHLLMNDDIAAAYNSTKQYSGWTPHLTMGYPETPAKKDTRDYPGIHWVNFDRIALWTGDYEGLEFPLKSSYGEEVSMSSDTIEHFGTKGMKWGVRKDKGYEGQQVSARKIRKLDKKFEKKADDFWFQIRHIHDASVKQINKDLDAINNKPQYKNADFTRDSPLRRKYYKETQKSFIDNLEKTAEAMGTNASGTKKYGILEYPNGTWDLVTKDVKHAESDDERITLDVVYDSTGHIVSIKIPDSSMEQADKAVSDALAHFGVLGMKWGVRRGEGSAGSGPEAIVVSPKKFGSGLKAKGGKGHAPTEDAINAVGAARKAQKSGLHSLSNKELQALTQRMNLEQQYVRLKETEPTAFHQGMLKIKKVLGLGKTLNEVHQFVNSPAGKEIQGLLKR